MEYGKPRGVRAPTLRHDLFFLPSNIVTYAKRKGLLFRPSDVHFVFTSPVSPKLVLLYAQVKQYLLNLLMVLLFVIAGIALFHIPVWKMLVYFSALLCSGKYSGDQPDGMPVRK